MMIQIKGLKKEYRLGQIGHGTLQRDLQSWWAKRRNKIDPNSKIGQEDRLQGDILQALNGVDLTVHQGECLGIIGGNGAGKSTLLKLISRVASPTSGTIDLYGRVTSMLEVGTGFHGEMTGRENIYLNGAILGMTKAEINEKLEQIIDFSEVREFIDTPVKRYSSGMYVKLAFAVASHLDSEIVIMDEVLAVGDIAFQKKCIHKMRQAARDESRTVLYVSHNMETVRNLCDRCLVLSEGKIIYDGEVERAISYYTQYLQTAKDESSLLIAKKRRDLTLTGQCKIADLSCDDTVSSGGTLGFRICLQSNRDLSNVSIRLLVCNSIGELVGMTYSDPQNIKCGTNWITYAFPTGNLAAGNYVCDIAVIDYSDGYEVKHDFLSKVMSFRISEKTIYFGRPWRVRTWGNVRLDKIETLGIEGMNHEQQ